MQVVTMCTSSKRHKKSEYYSLLTLFSSASEGKPSPNTVLALASDHWPNFCEVLVKVMFGNIVLLMMACQKNTTFDISNLLYNLLHILNKKTMGENKHSLNLFQCYLP